jgi:hypothetical protein
MAAISSRGMAVPEMMVRRPVRAKIPKVFMMFELKVGVCV